MSETVVSNLNLEVPPRRSAGMKSICLVGGSRILRMGVAELLREQGLTIGECYRSEEDLGNYIAENSRFQFDLIVLILTNAPFAAIQRIREVLDEAPDSVPLLVLSEHIGRGEVYAALRAGAKAYLDLDCNPEELGKAINLAASNKTYLSPEVAELLVNDVSAVSEPINKSRRLPSLDLSSREVEIVQLLCEGLSSKEIARQLHLSTKTIENHRYNIYRKCEVDSKRDCGWYRIYMRLKDLKALDQMKDIVPPKRHGLFLPTYERMAGEFWAVEGQPREGGDHE